MSSEAALAITNEKTIKDEDKDKLKWLVFHGNNDEDGVGVWSSASLSSAFWWQLRSLACVRARVRVSSGGRVSEWVFVCNHVRQAVMNGVFETERSVEFLGLDQIGNRKTNIP